ncbi:hypothetical protein HMPREF9946_03675 [Acetobacteraceae bacterium AT-5844]|nr:hypothetical protein HMPREF9946_03675 [Acetobacteraceae bacterium AT-5844]
MSRKREPSAQSRFCGTPPLVGATLRAGEDGAAVGCGCGCGCGCEGAVLRRALK